MDEKKQKQLFNAIVKAGELDEKMKTENVNNLNDFEEVVDGLIECFMDLNYFNDKEKKTVLKGIEISINGGGKELFFEELENILKKRAKKDDDIKVFKNFVNTKISIKNKDMLTFIKCINEAALFDKED